MKKKQAIATGDQIFFYRLMLSITEFLNDDQVYGSSEERLRDEIRVTDGNG